MNIKTIAISVSEKLELREIFKNKIQPASLMHLYTRKKRVYLQILYDSHKR